ADFNGDGMTDLIIANKDSRDIVVLLGQGDGTFQTAVRYDAAGSPFAIAIGDFNGDARPDCAVVTRPAAAFRVVNGNVSVLLNTCVIAGPEVVILLGNSTATVSWPLPSSGFVLESTTSLSPADWQPAPEVKSTNTSRLEVTAPIGPG